MATSNIPYNPLYTELPNLKSATFSTFRSLGGNTPDTYGSLLRISGTSFGANQIGSDTYYIGIASNGTLYSGYQTNQSSSVTWTALENA